MIDAADDLAGHPVEHVAAAAQGVGEDELVADRDDVERGGDRVGLPDERAVLRVEAPDEAVLGRLLRLVVAADVEAAVARGERAFGGDVVLVRLPDDVAGLRVEARGQAVVLRRQAAARPLARRVAEERGVEQLAVQEADAAVVAAAAVLREVLLPHHLAGVQVPGPEQRAVVLRVVRVVVGVDPGHDLAAVLRGFRRALERERLLRALAGVLAGAGGVDGEVAVHDRRELPAPARRAGERGLPQQLARGGVEAAHHGLLDAGLRDEQLAVDDRAAR